MAGVDIDIYGDLCPAAPPKRPPASSAPGVEEEGVALQVARPASQQPRVQQVPTMAPPPGSPPNAAPAPPVAGGPPPGAAPARGPQTWVAPGYEDWAYTGSFVVDGGEVVEAGDPIPSADKAGSGRPRDFEALRQELEAQEHPVAKGSPTNAADDKRRGPAEEVVAEDSDDDGEAAIQLGEVRASQVGAAPTRRWHRAANAAAAAAAEARTPEPPVPAPLPPLPAGQKVGPPECFVLLGGLPATLPAAELRRLAEKFGQLRAMRVLEDAVRPGRSAGIALLEYATPEGARRAAGAGDGLCSLSAWTLMLVAPPRLVLVGRELLGMMRAALRPWPDGGPCSDDLRAVLMRQFEQWALVTREPSNASRGRGDDSPPRRQSSGQLSNSESERPEGWADRLKMLKRKVNSKSDLGSDSVDSKRERLL